MSEGERIVTGGFLIQKCIKEALANKKGALIGRFGTIEFQTLVTKNETEDMRLILERNAGIFPNDKDLVQEWREAYTQAVKEADLLATGWYKPILKAEQVLLQEVGWNGQEIRLRSLEPYYVPSHLRWTNSLLERHVCVVSSFTETAKKQMEKGSKSIWGEEGSSLWPPTTRWSWVQTGYAPVLAKGRAGWSDVTEGEEILSWKDAVHWIVQSVEKTGAEIVLLGCGGLAMVVGEELKRKGKVCIVLGGAIQVFFGICGERWKNHDFISKLWNEEWVWPSREETPAGAGEVEGGCYWLKINNF